VPLDCSNRQSNAPLSETVSQAPDHASVCPRIERCEFESLLERAMEILGTQAKTVSSSHA
jgi:hypothetical protein